jgi:tetratricopeptide (TPR) repeat protein
MLSTSSLSLTNVRLESRDGACAREIDNAYHLYTAAQTATQLAPLLLAAVHMQAGQGAITLRTLLEHGISEDGHDGHARDLALDIEGMISGMNRLQNPKKPLYLGIAMSAADSAEAFLFQRSSSDVEASERWARHIIKQQRTMQETAEQIRKPYDPHLLEIRNEADRWFMSGLNRNGRDRDEDWTDALRLLQATVDNTAGMQDYVAWFQIGWIFWKHHNNLPQAEEAFYRAQRLSAASGNLYHVLSLRHFAYVQYLQGRHEGAYQTIQKALRYSKDHETRFDAARYAASTSRRAEALTLLEQCVRERPTTALTMFAEVDFQIRDGFPAMITDMAQLVSSLMHEVRVRLDQSVKQWQNAIHIVRIAEQQAECNLQLPSVLTTGMSEIAAQIRSADYLALLDYDKNTLGYADHTYRMAQEALKKEAASRRSVSDEFQREITEVQSKYETERRGMRDKKSYAQMLALQGRQRRKEDNTPLGVICFLIGVVGEIYGLPYVQNYLGLKHGPMSNGLAKADLYFAFLGLAWFIISLTIFLIFATLKRVMTPLPPPPKGFTDVPLMSQQQVRRRIQILHQKIAETDLYANKAEAALGFLNAH